MPGSPLRTPLAAGCLDLIRAGAHLVRDATDILSEISISIEKNPFMNHALEPPQQPAAGSLGLDKDYEMLLDALGFEPASIDDLVARTGLAAAPLPP